MFARFLPCSWDQAAWRERRGWIPPQSGLTPAELRGEYRAAWPAGAQRPRPGSGGSAGLWRSARASPQRQRTWLAPCCRLSGQSRPESPLVPCAGVPPTEAVLPAVPRVPALGGPGPRASGFTRLPCPGLSFGGQRFVRRGTGIWSSARGGAALHCRRCSGWCPGGSSPEPGPAGAALRAGGCLLCPVLVSARKLDWGLFFFLAAAFSYM